jgi:hypothetical protein
MPLLRSLLTYGYSKDLPATYSGKFATNEWNSLTLRNFSAGPNDVRIYRTLTKATRLTVNPLIRVICVTVVLCYLRSGRWLHGARATRNVATCAG